MKLVVDLIWTLQAACRNTHPETFFPRRLGLDHPEVQDAIAICAGCPVRQQCLEYAMTLEAHTVYRHGIYGGLTPHQRNKLVRDNAQAAA